MPGYESDRFVGLSQHEKSELTCSICQDIFQCPVVTNCCLQTFCEDCINDWLKTNNSCPYDRKQLNKSSLTRPPRILTNLLGNLKIKCNFREKGCNEVLLLENLAQHSLSCQYNLENWKKCEKCLCDWLIKSNHDCIKSLLELNNKANEEIIALKKKYESTTSKSNNPNISARINALKAAAECQNQNNSAQRVDSLSREIRKLKLEKSELSRKLKESDLEKENFLKTIQDLSDNQNSNVSTVRIGDLKLENKSQGTTATAIFDYAGQDFDEISFDPGDIITDIDEIDHGWWSGQCKGKTGLFPANYVKKNP